ncbi:MAG TPA: acylphosphatase [Burkholderiales bacterium]|nr:acylphosphatase [Burkholderiales bacterium]HYA46832.1 acylphosphatase [Burkholderiales bacterium]
MSDTVTLHVSVGGLVQGVGYREGLRLEAERLGVTGWVRNRRDGTVEAMIRGRREALDALLGWARVGPPAARVARMTVQEVPAALQRNYSAFERVPTI